MLQCVAVCCRLELHPVVSEMFSGISGTKREGERDRERGKERGRERKREKKKEGGKERERERERERENDCVFVCR